MSEQPELANFKYYRMRSRFLKWYLFLSKDGNSFDFEIGPFSYIECQAFVRDECQHLLDRDKEPHEL